MGLPRRLMAPRAQPVRWAMVGATTASTYFGLTLLFAGPAGLPIVLAIPCAYLPAVLLHFVLQRSFVFRRPEGFALGTRDQVRRYVLLGGSQVALAAIITSFLPGLIGVDERIVYVAATLSLASISYLMMWLHVFHGPRQAVASDHGG